MISVIFFALALIASVVYGNEVSNSTLDCKTFDPKNIKLITFDVFAALMDLDCKNKINIFPRIKYLIQLKFILISLFES